MKLENNPKCERIVSGNDSVVIRKYIAGVHGGRTLDVSGFEGTNIPAGFVIIKKEVDGNVVYQPMPVIPAVPAKPAQGETPAVAAQPAKYGTLPAGASYVGILKSTIPVNEPAAAIMTAGVVNSALLPYPMTDILTAFKSACPNIIFEQDEEA